MGNLDGCTFLLLKENGKKLLVGELPETLPDDFSFYDQQVLSCSYEIINDAMSICMAEDHVVKITCLEILTDTRPAKKDCVNTNSPLKVDWMKHIIHEEKPIEIVQYDYLDAWAYEFRYGRAASLFDCQGNLLADQNENKVLFDQRKKMMINGRTIWIMNN